jgi:3-oxoacyl-[acyl-carrier-protein] synthase III
MLIESLGTYLPPKIVSSAEIIEKCATPIRFPLERLTGIKNRRMAGDTEFALDIAKKAVADCFANSRYNPADIDLIICGSISRCNTPLQFWFEPNNSVQLQHHFGMHNALAFDISNACTGLFTCMYIAESFLKTGLIRRALVVSGEYISHLILTAQKEIESYMDSRLACLTVGDAGAALILEMGPDKQAGFHDFDMYTLGAYSEACIAKTTKHEHGGGIMYTDAVQVSTVNMKQAMAHAGYLIERAKWSHDAFQHIFVHQTSNTTIQDVARAFNKYYGSDVCNQDTVINNIAERANTATTAHMIALMDSIQNHTIQNNENVVFGITGSGATIGTALYTFDDLPDRIRCREAGTYIPEKVIPQQGPFIAHLPQTRRVRVESMGTLSENAEVQKETLARVRIAAENCFANSTHEKNETDLLIYTGTYRDEFICEPAIAALIAGKLEINPDIDVPQQKKTFALDILNGGVATLNACYTATVMMQAKKANNALIIASEVENNRDKLPKDLYGVEETGSAIFLDISPDGKTGFGNFVFKHFTDYVEALTTHTTVRDGKTYLDIKRDPYLERYYRQCIKETVQELLTREQLDLSQIKVILPPQISSNFIAELSQDLEVRLDKLVDVQAQHNLHTSSLAYALQHVSKHQLALPGDIGLLISVGSGIQVGCATYYF